MKGWGERRFCIGRATSREACRNGCGESVSRYRPATGPQTDPVYRQILQARIVGARAISDQDVVA